MRREVIVAADFSSKEDLFAFLDRLDGEKPYLKVGMELFYKEGPDMVRELKRRGFKIFLDLKLHDIPNTVRKAMRNLGPLGADIINVHAAGGIEMMKKAKQGLIEGGGADTKLIAVTQLTSTDSDMLKNELLIDRPMPDVVRAYAENAKAAGLDGVVCSPFEAAAVKELGLIGVTPGIRLAGDDVGDQKRVTTPRMARELQSAYIVVGRSITGAENPADAYRRCVKEFCGQEREYE